jgi:hypothetical protein
MGFPQPTKSKTGEARKRKISMADQFVQRQVFDLSTMTDVTARKPHASAPEVTSIEQALSLLGNDSKRLFSIIQNGLEADIKKTAGNEPGGWLTEDEDGKYTVPFSGIEADRDKFNALRLMIAKTSFGWTKDSTQEQKEAIYKAAADFIKSQPVLVAGLKAS